MSSKTKTDFTCDLCQQEIVTVEGDQLPAPWIRTEHTSLYTDSVFFTKIICPVCIKAVIRAAAAQ